MTGTGTLRPELEQAIQQADFAPGRFHLLGEVAALVHDFVG
jgi:hypothetical protein